ncbi:MAG TPA: hypothetical protein VMU48_11900 [Terracidiphilus sp.]|nr:hypothetical protein [Terracidiphilus sp.]
MAQERRAVKRILNEPGTLTDKRGNVINVSFSLTQWREYNGNIPGAQSADGSIAFENSQESWNAADGDKRTLKGGGVQAQVQVKSDSRFVVIGALKDL